MKVTKKGEEVEIIGTQPEVGSQAPGFSLKNLADKTVNLSDFIGTPVLISVVPDIDTRICSLQTKRFNQEAAQIEDIKFITISNNTKEEQANWCAAEGVDMEILHDTEGTFGDAYGLFIPEMGRLARGIFVIDKEGKLVYEAISAEIAEEPDYATALEKAKAAR
ncbi:AhpC/TSA family protein [Enterococcus moraviensis ATCC BAA-383]|uniref:AhpC/TSA family protein n=1 Tax=Enterococcus moraviensis ATCC BAA-383 TaxID=1158609 RepID=R2SP09_9ENTE|nr:thiol peroxidase [Enterococcus moraviensis]EOH96925.1 AhpC/TSA family protein [Enterococcus moraviensis ATCC BAA-383]EOT71460.1 AhpC/TSA family protein [Enterococcus moraviensis ATCC BAA-383]OJG68514.1 AhpC/TSA family protein [Enterococcus moraviensis]